MNFFSAVGKWSARHCQQSQRQLSPKMPAACLHGSDQVISVWNRSLQLLLGPKKHSSIKCPGCEIRLGAGICAGAWSCAGARGFCFTAPCTPEPQLTDLSCSWHCWCSGLSKCAFVVAQPLCTHFMLYKFLYCLSWLNCSCIVFGSITTPSPLYRFSR